MGNCGGIQEIKYSELISKSTKDNETGVYRNPSSIEHLPEGFQTLTGSKVSNIQEAFLNSATSFANNPCLGSRANLSREGDYVHKSYKQVEEIIKEIGSGIQMLNLAHEENNIKLVAIYGKNCEEWLMTDLAANCFGVTTVAIYDTLGADSMNFILNQTQVSTIFLSTQMTQNLLKQEKLKGFKTLIYFEQQEPINLSDKAQLESMGYIVMGMNELRKVGRDNLLEYPKLASSTLSTISYTSGTTGDPKGVMLSHLNITSVIGAMQASEVKFYPDDVHLSYLPLAHVFERILSYASLMAGVSIGYYSGDVLKLKADLASLKPTIFGSVPRLYNRFYDLMKAQFESFTGAKAALVNTAISTKIANLKQNAEYTHKLYDKLVFNKTAAVFGGRVRIMVTGSAPIQGDVLDFLKIATICPIIEGYGQTESGAASYLTQVKDPLSGHVGGPTSNVEMKIVAVPDMEYLVTDTNHKGDLTPRGELLIRGSGVFQGYYKDIVKTNEAKDKEGWLYTGDIVRLNPNGSINIIDRKKNIFKLSQGEYVAAEKLEMGYRVMSEIEEIFVYGDSLQAFLVTIIFPNETNIRKLADQNKIEQKNVSFENLIESDVLKKALLAKIALKAKELKFNGIEVPKQLFLIPKSFADYDCLTTSFKLQRHQAKKVFLPQIDKMYSK